LGAMFGAGPAGVPPDTSRLYGTTSLSLSVRVR
jgi:hypothetical protein